MLVFCQLSCGKVTSYKKFTTLVHPIFSSCFCFVPHLDLLLPSDVVLRIGQKGVGILAFSGTARLLSNGPQSSNQIDWAWWIGLSLLKTMENLPWNDLKVTAQGKNSDQLQSIPRLGACPLCLLLSNCRPQNCCNGTARASAQRKSHNNGYGHFKHQATGSFLVKVYVTFIITLPDA